MLEKIEQLSCVECGRAMRVDGDVYQCEHCPKKYTVDDGIVHAWPDELGELAREELEYHDEFDEDALDVHQLCTWRNQWYHRYIHDSIKNFSVSSRALEIGSGSSGIDAREVAKYHRLVCTDISPDTLKRLRSNLLEPAVEAFVAVDGEHIPFFHQSFDIVYMVATFHHFEHPDQALAEFARVLKPGGIVVMGVEPNATYFKPIKHMRQFLCKAVHMDPKEGSQADAMMEGFTYGRLKHLMSGAEWKDCTIRPMWLFAGWMHYFLEFLYRTFRMKKRITLPLWLEKIIVRIDELLFHIPGVKYLCWHWIIVATRSDKTV